MTTLWVKRVGNALYADGDESAAEFQKLPFGKSLHCEVKQPRNGAHHRLFWAVCSRIANGIGKESGDIAIVLKLATGHYTVIKSKSYGELRLPRSISFSKMDQTEFSQFFEKCLIVIFSEWGIERDAFSDLIDVKGDYGDTKTLTKQSAAA